jgi:hypothetical protein
MVTVISILAIVDIDPIIVATLSFKPKALTVQTGVTGVAGALEVYKLLILFVFFISFHPTLSRYSNYWLIMEDIG